MAQAVSYQPWEFWKRGLAGEEIGGALLPIPADTPQFGFYRMPHKKLWVAVAIFPNTSGNGQVEIVVDDMALRQMRHADVWHACATHPVSEDAYRHAVVTGEWADLETAIVDTTGTSKNFAGYKRDIELVVTTAGGFATIADDAALARAQGVRNKLNELANEANKEREGEKREALATCKRIDGAWQPIIKQARDAAVSIGRAMSAYIDARDRAAKDARVNEAPPAQVRGGYGRAAAIVPTVEIDPDAPVNWAALWGHYSIDQRAQAELLTLALYDRRRGVVVPGVVFIERKKVR